MLELDPRACSERVEPGRLVEYGGGGPVVRYEHLMDVHNNTFRMLRVIDTDPSTPPGMRNLKLVEYTDWSNWDFHGPASEFELFDLDADEWEQRNVYNCTAAGAGGSSSSSKCSGVSQAALLQLHARLEVLHRCAGATCN